MKFYKGITDPDDISQRTKDNIKNFIIRVSRDEDATWFTPTCSIWANGNPITVWSGDRYSEGASEVYLRHRSEVTIPQWVPGVLSAIVQLHRMEDDQEIKDALILIASKMAAGLFKSIQSNLAQSYNGTSLVHLAVNVLDNRLAGQYPGTEEDPTPIWREAINGNLVNIDEPGWAPFTLGA